jgi:4-hydroxy-tetrahydrodipicolinate synthase
MPLPILAGVIPPVVTPVDDDDCVDEKAFRRLLRHVIAGGVHGIFVGGSGGEGPLLTLPEWVRMMEIAYDEVGETVPLLGGVMDTSTRRVIERIKLLEGIGYRHYVVTPVYYLRMTSPDEHFRLLAACHDAAPDMELIPYNIPVFTGCQIPVEVIVEVAARGWVHYCKESSGDMAYFRRLVSEGGPVGLKVFIGDERSAREGLAAGACGLVPGCANFEPRTFVRVYDAARQGDEAALDRWFERMMVLRDHLALGSPSWLAGIKYAVACIGIGSGKLVSPLYTLTAEERGRIDEFVRESLQASQAA